MTGAKLTALTLKLSQTPASVVERVAKVFRDFRDRK
jgi:hypothetical protein